MFEDQDLGAADIEEHGKFVKALDASQEFRAVHQVDRDRDLFPAREIEETVLNVLWRWL